MNLVCKCAVAAGLAWLPLSAAAHAATLGDVKDRGHLVCGVNEGLPGFATNDTSTGTWSGFDVDFCRALAAAIFDDPSKVTYVPLSSAARFDVLRSGSIDVLSRNSTWTMGREVDLKLTFVGASYYDGQGFMVPADRDIISALDLGGSQICVQGNTTTELNLGDYFGANNMTYEPVVTKSSEESIAKYQAGECNALTGDMSALYAERLELEAPEDNIILPDAISKEPLGPVVRQEDAAWATLVRWVLFALLNGEELGVATDTIDEAMKSDKPDVKRLVGNEGDFGRVMGLDKRWAANILKSVGNYGEIFQANIGDDSPLGIPRGMNQLWSRGGIQYAPPIR